MALDLQIFRGFEAFPFNYFFSGTLGEEWSSIKCLIRGTTLLAKGWWASPFRWLTAPTFVYFDVVPFEQLFRFTDRKDVPFLLSPTHEEEITTLVARTVKSYKEVPLRLYQISKSRALSPPHFLVGSRR